MSRSSALFLLTWLAFPSCSFLFSQQQLGSIVGQVRVARGDFPSESILVSLEFRGSQIESIYTDAQGKFGFHNLAPNPYYVNINDDHYDPVRELATLNPMGSTITIVNVTLVPRIARAAPNGTPTKLGGANQNTTDVREYSAKFPKSAVKEFERGLASDGKAKKDDAIRHYQKAIQIAPDFYAAHNNLGSSYLSKSDLPAARTEFEQVVRLNQSDASAYFNLSNVCLLLKELPDAQRFLNEGLRREPDSPLGQFLRGSLDMRLGKLPEAEDALEQAIKLDPVMAQARLQLVNLYLQEGKKTDAIAQLQSFVDAFPGNPLSPRAKQLLQRLNASAAATAQN